MSKILKSTLTVNGNSIRVAMPFSKVDKENRLVTGFATMDNLDTQGDIVLAEASRTAFERARGNLREMHQPIAAGHLVDFTEEEYFDTESNELYRGIFVTAYISKGAPNTWEKVLDETLTGFSIGGEITEVDNQFVKDANGGKGANVRFIKSYDLVELSLVDNPANHLANVFSIQKSATGSVTVTGMAADTKIDNVFICKDDTTVIVKESAAENCPTCGKAMENAGWFESGTDRAEKVRGIVTKFLTPDEREAAPSSEEGGVEMGNKVTKAEDGEQKTNVVNPSEENPDGDKWEEEAPTTLPEDPDAEADATADVDETGDSEVEKVAEVEEVTDDETEIVKKMNELREALTTSLEKSRDETGEQVSALEQKVTDAVDSFMNKASELETKLEEFGEKLDTSKARLADLEGKVEKVRASGAIKKSGDVEPTPVERVQKESFWDGAFSD